MSKIFCFFSGIIIFLCLTGCRNLSSDAYEKKAAAQYSVPYKWNGTPDKKSGWTIRAAKEGKMVYIPFEGYYENKGGRIQSPRICLKKAAGESGFFRLRFQAKTPVNGYWWIDLFDDKGNQLPDINSALYPSDSMLQYDEIIFTDSRAKYAVLAFILKKDAIVQNIQFESASAQEAAVWCDQQYAKLTSEKFTAPADAFAKLPKTREALRTGKTWRILMLGDSIVNDTWTSNFQALVMRDFPSAKLDFFLSVRGATGCWYYQDAKNFQKYVADFKPDLVMIGGISNTAPKAKNIDSEKAMITVIDRCKKLGCEVLVMSPPHSMECRTSTEKKIVWDKLSTTSKGYTYLRRDYQRAAVAKTGVAYWDLTTYPCNIVDKSGKPLGWFNRDRVHNNDRGKQLIGQTLAAWFHQAK